MCPDLFDQMRDALQLAGLSNKTQAAYLRAVRLLCDHYHTPPQSICEGQLRAYFLFRRNYSRWSASTLRIQYFGVRFFFTHVLQRDWHTLALMHARREQRLPAVLSVAEVRALLAAVRLPQFRVFLSTIYACGLRLQEAQHLQVADIDAQRGLIHIHRGKGAKDRLVPLPPSTLRMLREHWATHRNRQWLFPASGRGDVRLAGARASLATLPMPTGGAQEALRLAKTAAGIHKTGVSVHTLRHSYATHLIEAGVPLPTVQRYLGHAQIQTTLVYVHLTETGQGDAAMRIQALMADLP